jgi:hypothetical protein
MAKKSKVLVVQHLEKISRDALEDYKPLLKEYVSGKTAVYALYRGDRLKYVGLATNLLGRLNTHCHDKLAHAWDRFSVYLTAGDEHLRELEALVIRIAKPPQNRQDTKFAGSEDLRKLVKKDLVRHQRKEIENLGFGKTRVTRPRPSLSGRTKAKEKKTVSKRQQEPTLGPYVKHWFIMRADYRGKRYNAKVRANGKINFNGRLYLSPSAAGLAITRKKALSGWKFWKYRDENGEWVWLGEIRNGK